MREIYSTYSNVLRRATDFKFNKITLNFVDQDLEKNFRLEYFKKSLFSFRIAFVTLIILYSAFGYLDYLTSSKFYTEFFIIRYFIALPVFIGVLILSFYSFFYKVWQSTISCCFVIGGSGILYMVLRNPENTYYYGGMLLVLMAGYFFIKLRFFWAMIAGVLLVFIYNGGAILFNMLFDYDYESLFVTNAFYISANIIGMLALYNIERLERVDFYQKILISEKQQEITLINQNLEADVMDRTKLLDDRNKELVAEIGIRKEIEKEHMIAKNKAEESDRLKSAFLANMSHEIRTPMNGILGFADLLKTPHLTGDEQEQFVDIIKNSGERLLNIINDLIDISKVESGQMEVFISETNINEQVGYIFSFFKPEVERKGLNLICNKPKELINLVISTDREKLYAILTNLVKNAIKYTVKGTIEFGYSKNGEHIEFFVRDSGIGIEERDHKTVFERFRQANELLSHQNEGAGLGLSISKAYVEMLGGTIWLESEKGKGSTFFFTIPDNSKPHQLNEETGEFGKTAPVNGIGGLKILIAEDDPASEMLISIAVKRHGNSVLKVKRGVDAVETCQLHPDIDLILMDIKMADMDGYEATRQIRTFNNDVVIIAQTAFGMTNDKEKALAAGCNDYIAKPINLTLLNKLITQHIRPK